jgi:hypothetical protein
MKSDCYFNECKYCVNKDYNDCFSGCLANRLRLAFYKLLIEIPLINKIIDNHIYCYRFESKE